MAHSPLHTLKAAAVRVGFHAGLFRLVQFTRRQQAVILTFHRFRHDGEGDPHGTPITSFAECLKYLARYYRVVSLGEMAGAFRRGVIPDNLAVVTIDDGYREVFSLAAPVLRRHGIRASIFVISGFIAGRLWPWHSRLHFIFEYAPQGRTIFQHRGSAHTLTLEHAWGRWCAERFWCEYSKAIPPAAREDLLNALAAACGVVVPASPPERDRPMTWTQLRTLAAQGFDMGAHTCSHPILSQLPRTQLMDEIAGCKEEIERNLGQPVRYFAYPNGQRQDYTPECIAAVARAGYAAAVTTIPGGNTPQTPIFELRRISERSEDLPHFVQAVTGVDLLKDRIRAAFHGDGQGRSPEGAGHES